MKQKIIFFVLFLLNNLIVFSQKSTYVDDNGVFRYTENDEEIRLFGVNYTLPFAHGYRAMNYIGKDHKQAIDKDVYHITRLGVDAYRVHIWDAEITDQNGNLIQTKQLELLDYLLAKLKKRGIKTIITPFKVGGNGYPEKDFPAPGFSATLQKWQTYADEEILQKQERYFTQLLNHINPYTEKAYKNDSDIIALEINNEPRHTDESSITPYINRMVGVIRKTGFKNPIFYNVSERPEYVDNYLKADIQGCTFQWYPTGLVHNSLMDINFLPNVNQYQIPFENKDNFKNKTRIIYEFDPADTNQPTLYPAMARSFRESKFQFATQFAYDAIDLAFANTEYQTHYLNLVYTPSKAISLKISAEAFREIGNGQSFGNYPENNTFVNTTLYPEENLALYNSDQKYFYTNSTQTKPKNLRKLNEIAGVGNSTLVKYDGTGAYFLDKVDKGIWRLEVMPDVLWVKDPFEKASLNKTVAVLKAYSNEMQVFLPDLGEGFYITPINEGNTFQTNLKNEKFEIQPGTYLLHDKKNIKEIETDQKFKNIRLNEFYSTKQNLNQTYVVHEPKKYRLKDEELFINAKIVAPSEIDKVEVVVNSGYLKTTSYEMSKTDNFNYQVVVPKTEIYSNLFQYYISVFSSEDCVTFPNHVNGFPEDWDFISNESYETSTIQNDAQIILYETVDHQHKNFIWPKYTESLKYNIDIQRYKSSAERELKVTANFSDTRSPKFTFKIIVKDIIENEIENLNSKNSISIVASSGFKESQKAEIGLQLKTGQVFAKTIDLADVKEEIDISFSDLKPVSQILLPSAYPTFQAKSFMSTNSSNFDIERIEAIQISIEPGTESENLEHQLIIEKISLK